MSDRRCDACGRLVLPGSDCARGECDAQVRREQVAELESLRARVRQESARAAAAERERDEARELVDLARTNSHTLGRIIREQIAALSAAERRAAEAEALIGRIVKYAREDRARTPGTTRLARALDEADQLLALRSRPQPAATSSGDVCPRCNGTAWLESIPPKCAACGHVIAWPAATSSGEPGSDK